MPPDVLLKQHAAKLSERLRRRVVQRADDGLPFLDFKRQDAGAVPVGGLEAFGECLVVDQTGELETSVPGIGRPARYMSDIRPILPEQVFGCKLATA